MSTNDQFLRTVEAIYASGTDDGRLPDALAAASRLLGARGATLEVIDKTAMRHIAYCAAGLPPIANAQYIDHFAALNPRRPPILRQRSGELGWDHKFMDERAMARNPFYSEFLPSLGLRYFISAILEQTPDRLSVVTVQRTRKQGHVERREISLMQRLCPHFQRSHDMRRRQKSAGVRNDMLENALDLLADGIALLGSGGKLVYANDALCKLAARGHDFSLARGALEFASPDVRSRFATASNAAERFGDLSSITGPTDFVVPRGDGLPAYTVSVQPLVRSKSQTTGHPAAVAMVLLHDPLDRNFAAGEMLQELFCLTRAETHLVCALGTGMTAGAYARNRRVSITTVYTHLRRTREKTGWKSVAELTRRFNELNTTLRLN